MKVKLNLILLLLLMFSTTAYAQEAASAAEAVDKLRAQLLEVQAREDALRSRAQQLEESLKPENIERSLAGIGSTRPEELRESRRRQLTIERDGVQAQLKTVQTSRERLETAVANAEIRAYQQSARPTEMMSSSSARKYQWLMLASGGLAALALGGGAVFYRRKTKSRQS